MMLEDAPDDIIAKLSPQDADICTQGRLLRAQQPSYLERERAAIVAHCILPAMLHSLVGAYAVMTPEDMWWMGYVCERPEREQKGGPRTEMAC